MLDNSDMKHLELKERRPHPRARGWNGRQKRRVSVLTLLHWAFQNECAGVTFDAYRDSDQIQPGFGMEYIMIERAKLGARIDGGGSSDPHEDAQAVVNALAVLPERVGGRAMAITIAELARSGRFPDWMPEARPRILPVEIKRNQHGWHSATKVAETVRFRHRGRIIQREVRYCPVRISPTAQQIGSARRAYLAWWGALLELKHSFQIYGGLTCHEITDHMPNMSPWKIKLD